MRRLALLLSIAALPCLGPARAGAAGVGGEAAFARFCTAPPDQREAAAAAVVDSGIDFDAAFARRERGGAGVTPPRRARRLLSRRNRDGQLHPYLVLGPENPMAGRRYPVRFYLHGGINRPRFEPGQSWWRDPERLVGDWITVLPASWNESPWWRASQVENLAGILDRLKRDYDVDENRVYMVGISDGGSGVYYQAMRNPTPWAAFLPFIGSATVAASSRLADGELHLANLVNRPFYIVNGEVDRLYPVRSVEPFVRQLRQAGADVVFRPLEGVGHEMGWWPAEAAAIERFLEERVRDPLPDRLDWQVGAAPGFDRIHWLVVTEPEQKDGSVDARIAAQRRDNTVVVRSAGVERFKLLLSPRQFDLGRPLRVMVNERLVHDGLVGPSLETLLRWAARDLDRTMLFAAELEIEVPLQP